MDFRQAIARIKNYLSRRSKPAFYELMLTTLQPRKIVVEEQYRYELKLTGVQDRKFLGAEGQINVTVPYDGRRHIDPSLELEESVQRRIEQGLKRRFIPVWGKLKIKSFGNSLLNEQPVSDLEQYRLPLGTGFRAPELAPIRANPRGRFNIQISQAYQPIEPERVPVEIQVKVSDEEEVKDKPELEREVAGRKEKPLTAESLLIRNITSQTSFQRTLKFRFRVIVKLPEYLKPDQEAILASMKVSHMTMDWPIATAPSQPRLGAQDSSLQVIFNPNPEDRREGYGALEWFGIPLKPMKDSSYYFESDEIWLEVDEPGEAQSEQLLQGKVKIEFEELLSGLQIMYEGWVHKSVDKRSTIQINYKIDLDDCFADKRYSPQQHLQLPGIILDEFRLADVLMLLKDKLFEVTQPFENSELEGTNNGNRRYIVKATRAEGAGELILWMLIQGIPYETTRERETKGKARYRTNLPTGRAVVYMHGGLHGDMKRAIQVLNEIHRQLKQYFRYVGTVD